MKRPGSVNMKQILGKRDRHTTLVDLVGVVGVLFL